MKKINIIAFLSILILSRYLYAEDIEKFKAYNPDGQKYEFVRNYLTSLSYFKANDEKSENVVIKISSELDDADKVASLIENLVQENANLRAARNLLKKYKTSPNGLILKVTDLFAKVCDEQIDFNDREKNILKNLHDVLVKADIQNFDKRDFVRTQRWLASERKESLKKLLEASMLVKKVLVSNKPDAYGELTSLGITKEERKKLLSKMNDLFGKNYRGELQEGQSFIKGSILVIRGVLEDTTWGTIDG